MLLLKCKQLEQTRFRGKKKYIKIYSKLISLILLLVIFETFVTRVAAKCKFSFLQERRFNFVAILNEMIFL